MLRAPRRQAARTLSRNRSTSALKFADCCDKWLDAASTSFDMRPVSVAACETPAILDETSVVLFEACWTLRAISWVAGRPLDGVDLFGDLAGGLCRLAGERLHFGRHDGKALAGVAGPRPFDGGVEGQEVRLAGDVVDQLDDVADLLRRLAQGLHLVVGPAGILDRLAGGPGGLHHPLMATFSMLRKVRIGLDLVTRPSGRPDLSGRESPPHRG